MHSSVTPNTGTPVGPQITAEIASLSASGGGVLSFDPGTYLIQTINNGQVFVYDNVTLQGAGMGVTFFTVDDTTSGAPSGFSPVATASGPAALNNFHFEDLTIQGMAATTPSIGSHLISFHGGGQNVSLKNVELLYSRYMGCSMTGFDRVLIENCRLLYSNADGFAIWDSSNVDIVSNYIRGTGDDSISLHTSDTAPSPLRSSIRVLGNTIEDAQGINAAGAKSLIIANNTLRRIMSYGVNVGGGSIGATGGFAQGHTPMYNVSVHDNVIEDVFLRSDTGTNREQYYIRVSGGPASAGQGVSVPGYPSSPSGSVASLYGAGAGNFRVNDTLIFDNTSNTWVSNPMVASTGSYWIRIERNHFVRTLPAVMQISDWGYSTNGMWMGKGNGFQNLSVTEAQLNTRGMYVSGALRNSTIKDNVFQTTAARCIEFLGTPADGNYDGLLIDGNQFIDFKEAGIFYGLIPTTQRITVSNNSFDADPHFTSSYRGPNGTWANWTFPYGLYCPSLSGLNIRNNRFRNMTDSLVMPTPAGLNTSGVVKDNVLYCDPLVPHYSTTNKGIAQVHPAGAEYSHIIEVCDPTDANYGKIKSPTVFSALVVPTSGTYVTGHFVTNSNPVVSGGALTIGWMRLTTGSSHVVGTDWFACIVT